MIQSGPIVKIYFPLFLELLEDLETSEIDKIHIVKYKNLVLKLPVNR